ncbi:hypothetical protein M0805_008767 [Coniferiporia weirii]|nr:hypothetical protein M0805_008767 [Coniferiporia weirii]
MYSPHGRADPMSPGFAPRAVDQLSEHDTSEPGPLKSSDKPWTLVKSTDSSDNLMDVDQKGDPSGGIDDDLRAPDSDAEFVDAGSATSSAVSINRLGSTSSSPVSNVPAKEQSKEYLDDDYPERPSLPTSDNSKSSAQSLVILETDQDKSKDGSTNEKSQVVDYELPGPQKHILLADANPKRQETIDTVFSPKPEAKHMLHPDSITKSEATQGSFVPHKMDTPQRSQSLDLVDNIKGMYRILDLISEQGSGGLVDKVIIAQNSSGRLINDLKPKAYKDLTKIDFKALDDTRVKPLGIYGSKSQIVRFLSALGVIDNRTEMLLNAAQDASTVSPTLRSGLYALMVQGDSAAERRLYVIFWPEDTTWDDNAISTVRRNRITFMRYLTKITDQIMVLISDAHGGALVWEDPESGVDDGSSVMTMDDIEEETDRLFAFEVSKANEQEENVRIRSGFEFKSPFIEESPVPEDLSLVARQPWTRLVAGDTKQALLTATYNPPRKSQKDLYETYQNSMQLRAALFAENKALRLHRSLSHDAIDILIKNGLKERYPEAVEAFEKRTADTEELLKTERESRIEQINKNIESEKSRLAFALETYFVGKVLTQFSKLEEAALRDRNCDEVPSKEAQDTDREYMKGLFELHPTLLQKVRESQPDEKFTSIRSDGREFTKAMMKVFICDHIFSHNSLSEAERLIVWKLINSGVESGSMKDATKFLKDEDGPHGSVLSSIVGGITKISRGLFTITTGFPAEPEGPIEEARAATRDLKSFDFFDRVDGIVERWPELVLGVQETFKVAHSHFSKKIKDALRALPHKLMHEQKEHFKRELERELETKFNSKLKSSLSQLFDDLEQIYSSEMGSQHVIFLKKLELQTSPYRYSDSYRCHGHHIMQSEPSLKYTIHTLELKEHDKQQMKTDPSFIPKPAFAAQHAYDFSLPIGSEIRLLQLLENNKSLIIVEDLGHDLRVFLENLSNLDSAIANGRSKKVIKREKTGHDIVVAYDEGRRALVVCGIDIQKPSVQLHCFAFDERYTSLQGQGSAINLTGWYTGVPKIIRVLFISGTDEFALIEESGKVRIFSSVTQQFRPAILQLPASPMATFGTPDGSCLAALFDQGNGFSLCVYHWASLGSHEGFSFDFPDLPDQAPLISALDEKKNVHLIWMDLKGNSCRSSGIDITRQTTEFQFRKKTSKNTTQSDQRRTAHNSLVDCHSDVWTRFPVVPAVRRQAIVSSELRREKSILFVTTARINVPFVSYFYDMIQTFEKSTKKPTASLLSSISVLTGEFSTVLSGLRTQNGWSYVSSYKAGEWMVDIFCLIPIHIAIARDNRFIPLKDGVWAPEAEKALLGADVGRVADSLSLGWYESIFQLYMSMKPVKVVSSMGEQSVGKSFALNHLADTSFAGSAMRTTEGVWMSVTPTDDDLIVALDFEGVHSIERSAQEDTLLVLFNAAISNLVLFRNNFALSRDITNLFQSFQSSSSILDPDANPTLFQSTLAIIIKDVVDSDRVEIAREFELKLHRIVEEEQASNFISRLYRGRLNIIPWPVIESRQFYTLFSTLKRHLDKQSATHEGGGTFLQKMKMLMAKLKTNDWGSLSQNMSTHRAQHLLSLLPRALAFGATETEPDIEPLKNYDTNLVVDAADSMAVFWLKEAKESQEGMADNLRGLLRLWPDYSSRSYTPEVDWIAQLCAFLQNLVEQRVAHVQAWVDSNLSQFNGSNAAIDDFHRALDVKFVELRRSVQLCKTQCERCHFLCLSSRFHEDSHNCSTDHRCPHLCQFVDEHIGNPDPCSLSAGHEGEHICDPMAHLCGHRCDLEDRKGCQGSCTKVASHDEEEHMCSAKRHSCGKPCSLQEVKSVDGGVYTCQGICSALWNEEHEAHICDAPMACPIACQLCGRLCSTPDHLHGLEPDAIHLCGQEHKCISLCSSVGVCEIDTVPQSIEATFNGAHDKFQYTKYSQVTKRLQCAVPIAPGCIRHEGSHVHSTASNVFHYCDSRCDNCGYVCTFPQGHSQPEHSTNHGSMSKTLWAVDGPNGTVLELDGHKFGSSDDGAPMLCNLMCSDMGRHAHIDYCRASPPTACSAQETDHIKGLIEPNPERPKDWISHKLYWRRLGLYDIPDPYSKEEQSNFAKCDAMCCGQEHKATATSAAQPSYCNLPIFHPPAALNQVPSGGTGHVSNDGHVFLCKNPAVLSQAFHVIFVIDRSGSMSLDDRRPLPNYPASAGIARVANNRLGAVYSALHSFWSARATAMSQASVASRRDAYSAILFMGAASEIFNNDFNSTPDQLLAKLLRHGADGGTNFDAAIATTERVMARHWSTERAPVVIFLSDGECSMTDNIMYSLCRKAVSLGRALSFHAVSFGPEGSSTWLRRMTQIAQEVQAHAPRDPLLQANAVVASSYSVALDSVRLSETFLGIAESLRKTRGGLIRQVNMVDMPSMECGEEESIYYAGPS